MSLFCLNDISSVKYFILIITLMSAIAIIDEFKESKELTNDVIMAVAWVMKNDIADSYKDIVDEFVANGFVDRR